MAACTGVCIVAPASNIAQIAAGILPLSEPHAAAAADALGRRDFGRAKHETTAELATSPIRQDAWLRLADIDVAEHGRLTGEGQTALSHAYDAVPYDLDPASPRMAFVLAHFSMLAPPVRGGVTDELGIWATSPPLRRRLAAVEKGAQDVAELIAIKTALAEADPSSPQAPPIAAEQPEDGR